ncbi:MAG: minC [Firmicutes bacterium]|nr:minC [Bacillota bacterium]
MREAVVFKGVSGELQLVVNESAEFGDVLKQLTAKLAAANEFFNKNAVINLPTKLTDDERRRLTGVLTEYGLEAKEQAGGKPVKKVKKVHSAVEGGYETEALVINRTLRSGQKVVYGGSVVIIGDLNPGAEVVAGENIIILGACRGMAHAGASGNQGATITASRVLATQLRIADLIARAPDDVDKPAQVETARIKDKTVVIEPASR